MSIFWLTAYILVWPLIAAGVMGLLTVSILRDMRRARQEGGQIV